MFGGFFGGLRSWWCDLRFRGPFLMDGWFFVWVVCPKALGVCESAKTTAV